MKPELYVYVNIREVISAFKFTQLLRTAAVGDEDVANRYLESLFEREVAYEAGHCQRESDREDGIRSGGFNHCQCLLCFLVN